MISVWWTENTGFPWRCGSSGIIRWPKFGISRGAASTSLLTTRNASSSDPGRGPHSSSQKPVCSTSNRTPRRGSSSHSRSSSSSPDRQSGNSGAPRERRLKKVAEIGREPESEQRLRLTGLGIGEAGVKLDPVDRGVRGDYPKTVLGSVEVFDEVLPIGATHSGSPILKAAAANLTI